MAKTEDPVIPPTPAVPETVPDADFAKELREYAASYSDELRSKMKRLDLLIGDSHWLSVGTYKEALVRGLLQNKIPKRFEVGTGFVMSVRDSKPIRSRQLDVVIWDAHEHAPIFRDGDFVIIPPEACRAAIEVKGTLDHASLSDALLNLDSLSAFSVVRDIPRHSSIHRSVFAFGRAPKYAFPSSVWNTINAHYQIKGVEKLDKRIDWSRNNSDCWSHPWINCVALLNNGVINCELWSLNDEQQIAYVGYEASEAAPLDAWGFLERSILLDLGVAHNRHLCSYQMPGMVAILFANRAKKLADKFYMLFPGLAAPLTKAARWSKEAVEDLALREFTPRKPTVSKKKKKKTSL